MAATTAVAPFLRLLPQSGLLDRPQLAAYLRGLEAVGGLPDDPADLAARMVADGLLTEFQAEQLLAGKYQGFTLGKYRLLERLGAGGMGAVFLAVHLQMARRVALKVLPPERTADLGALERFYREARAAAALDHRNLARAHDVGEADGLHFLVMEYVDGVSLQDLVDRHGPLAPGRAAAYVWQAALGLQHAHDKGLVHRDVKPGNLLVDRQGVVKVLDMGLARFFQAADNLTRDLDSRTILGTADFIAPEQAMDSHTADVRADLYSLGCTLFFLLTGRPPFGAGSAAQKLLWHQTRAVPDVRGLRPDVPAGLAAVLARLVAKDPAARYQTPAEAAAALAPFVPADLPPPQEHELPHRCKAAGGGGAPSTWKGRRAPVTQGPGRLPVARRPPAPASVAKRPPRRSHATAVMWIAAGAAVVVLIGALLLLWQVAQTGGPPPGPIIMEGEALRVVARSANYPVGPQDMRPFTAARWSGGAQLFGQAGAAGAWADLGIPISRAGKYRLLVQLTRAPDYGQIQFSLGGRPLGEVVDGYVPETVVTSGLMDLGIVDLPAGETVLRVTVVGTNPKSLGARFYWGLDQLILQPAP